MDRYTEALTNLSPVAWIVAALVILVVGSLWYSPFMFGKSWARHTGIRPHDIHPSDVRRSYIFAVFSALFLSYLLGIVASHATSVPALAASVVFIWVFVMIEQFNSFVWERAAFALFLINALRSLAALAAAALTHHLFEVL